MNDETYAQQVNRRLTAARLLLKLDEGSELNSTPVGRSAILESALVQLYFAFYSYLNELLFYYKKPNIEYPSFNLHTLLSDTEKSFEGGNEFSVLKKWGRDKGDIFNELSSLPMKLAALSPKKIAGSGEVKVTSKPILSNPNLILVSDGLTSSEENKHNSKFVLDDKSDVKKLVDDFQLLVDTQREGQLEY